MTGQQKSNKRFPWRTAIISAALVVVLSFPLIAYLKTCSVTEREIAAKEDLLKALPGLAEKFKTGTITSTFRQSISAISPTGGDVLEVATLDTDESFKKEDSKNILWDWLYMGTTVAEIRVPVTFRYHVRLSDRWRLAARDNVCLVLAPRVRPSLPPAIHTDEIEKSTERGWARFNEEDLLAQLEKSITPTLEARAADEKHLRLVREACRQSVAEFVKKWLMEEDHWREDRFSSVHIVFPDEVSVGSDEELEQLEGLPPVDPGFQTTGE